uniref:Regulatory protein E2 n=1 Tax=Pipistrellus kuhlii papillomavirus TaxID=3140005 RepID=A0AAU6S5D1_9PAPI
MNLSSRLESIQETILNLYELDSDDLSDQIKFWDLTRKENLLLYYARKQGITTLAHQHVPSLASSEAKARAAIEMTLLLRSLERTPYGREPWNMQQTSRERLLAPPAYCLKKGGGPVQVQFDNDPSNTVEHTAWENIYYQDEDDEWQKVPGEVDLDGLYYIQEDGLKLYYVDFKEEAAKYSQTGKWCLLYNNNCLASVASSPGTPSRPLHSSSPRPQERRTSSDSEEAEELGWETHETQGAQRGRRSRRVRTRSRSRSKGTTRSSPISVLPQVGETTLPTRPGGGRGRAPQLPSPRSRSRSGGSGSGERRRGRSRGSPGAGARKRGPRPTRPSVPLPAQVGSSRESSRGRPAGRLGQLLQEAWDPPGICLRGPANTLKCLRYSLKSRHSKWFTNISTTWHWTESNSTTRVGRARVLVVFTDEEQRSNFLSKVTLPKSVSYYLVSLGDI